MTLSYLALADLLAEHRLSGVEETPLAHAGFSGATLTRLMRSDGSSFVLKRMSIERDWIMRATDDATCREAAFAMARIDLGAQIMAPTVGAARDGTTYSILMRDITPDLLPESAVSSDQLNTVIGSMAALHRLPVPGFGGVPWCHLGRRLTLLTPSGAEIARGYGAPVASDLVEGWRLFDEHASPAAREIIHPLFNDLSPLLRTLTQMSSSLLHGDVKFDNVGISPEGRTWFIDWAMTLVAPPAVELGWFMAINSRRLPVGLDDVMRRYADAADLPADERERHEALSVLCGLLLRGWRKALDAEHGDASELDWWSERAAEARRFLA